MHLLSGLHEPEEIEVPQLRRRAREAAAAPPESGGLNAMPSVLVTGSNRGIGLEFVRQYAADGWRVFATCRKPAEAAQLRKIKGDVRVHALDVTDDAQVASLAGELRAEPLDILINNAGVIGPHDSFGKTEPEGWAETLRINSIAPLRVLERFLPNLERGQQKKAMSLTSGMGSIGDNTSGGSYAYRTSKAALNQAMRSASIDLKRQGIIVVVMNPGWVKTDMGGRSAPLPVEDSVSDMRKVLAGLKPADSGKFLNHTGATYPW
jgi:NAD(P)-dependent dehydrogenase (short-subunit alcohol dehydrogenase family)